MSTPRQVYPSPLGEVGDWGRGYVQRHPVAALNTVGSQCILGLQAIRYLIVDIVRWRFPFWEFVEQAAFMASTAMLPTMCVAIPIGVTLQIQFALLAGQVGATSLAGAASGLAVIRQGAPLVAALLMGPLWVRRSVRTSDRAPSVKRWTPLKCWVSRRYVS
ncbi:YrbE family protein, YrbE5A [Mycolicibacterium novocastrense]|uniref:YrbE family protein, YrbE5A n=1 Tax=Mycolicibacterium novocastrense TaxID=59813 RepID=A0ABQ0KJ36_MYCNV|nr:YrbE family protein, YrbE5A [Mycolicibacterium novocastrense]